MLTRDELVYLEELLAGDLGHWQWVDTVLNKGPELPSAKLVRQRISLANSLRTAVAETRLHLQDPEDV